MTEKESNKPKVIGLYGLPGSGKSTLLRKLLEEPDQHDFLLYEGSEKIAEICPGGITAFKNLNYAEKKTYREQAIRNIQQQCIHGGRSAVVTGHFMFWHEGNESFGDEVWTAADADTYTHIIYLDVPARDIENQRSADSNRPSRDSIQVEDIEAWKQAEKDGLRSVCHDHGILFSLVQSCGADVLTRVLQLLQDFSIHDEGYNHTKLIGRLDEVISGHCEDAETVLIFDADKTVAPFDSGELFWSISSPNGTEALKRVFRSFGRSYQGFRQLMLEHESFEEDTIFEKRCAEVADKIEIYPELLWLLRLKAKDPSFRIIIVTCGLSRVWKLVLEREGLSDSVHVIGSGRLDCKFVVTPEGKRDVVAHLQSKYKLLVWAFGDSPLDLPMLQQADEAIVVVAAESIRSKSMDSVLEKTIDEQAFRARQLLLPSNEEIRPRLSKAKLPVVDFADLIAQELHPTVRGRLELIQGTDTTSSKLLATHMRNARISGHDLRKVHTDAGYCLALEYVSEIIGLEQVSIPHVTGGQTLGHRLRHEARTLIVACMRGGEPLAFGVSKAFPSARFFHANKATDIGSQHLEGLSCVIVVDSVVNEGTTIVNFVRRIRRLHGSIRIIVVAGVVQAACVDDAGLIAQSLDRHGRLTIVALRLSENKYTGSGVTDTGNRLFNTTYERKQERLVLQRSIS